jgi:hypothetical protein
MPTLVRVPPIEASQHHHSMDLGAGFHGADGLYVEDDILRFRGVVGSPKACFHACFWVPVNLPTPEWHLIDTRLYLILSHVAPLKL